MMEGERYAAFFWQFYSRSQRQYLEASRARSGGAPDRSRFTHGRRIFILTPVFLGETREVEAEAEELTGPFL